MEGIFLEGVEVRQEKIFREPTLLGGEVGCSISNTMRTKEWATASNIYNKNIKKTVYMFVCLSFIDSKTSGPIL